MSKTDDFFCKMKTLFADWNNEIKKFIREAFKIIVGRNYLNVNKQCLFCSFIQMRTTNFVNLVNGLFEFSNFILFKVKLNTKECFLFYRFYFIDIFFKFWGLNKHLWFFLDFKVNHYFLLWIRLWVDFSVIFLFFFCSGNW